MALSDIKKSELEDDSISTRVKGWDVFIERVGTRYYFSIFLCYDDDSDAAITVVSREYCYTIADLKAEIMQTINDLPLTTAEAAKRAALCDAGHISIEDLEKPGDLDSLCIKAGLSSAGQLSEMSGQSTDTLCRLREESGPLFDLILTGAACKALLCHDVPAILQEQSA